MTTILKRMENPDLNAEMESGSDQVNTCDTSNANLSSGKFCDREALTKPGCFDRHLETRQSKQYILTGTIDWKTHSEPCKVHESLFLELYCVNHNTVGCAKCMFPDHSKCNFEKIEEAAKRYKDNGGIAGLSKKIHGLDYTYTESIQRVQLLKQSVESADVKTVNDIQAFEVSLDLNVDQTVKVALAKAKRLRIDNENQIDKLSTELEKIGNAISSLKDSLKSSDGLKSLFIVALETEPMLAYFQERLSILKNEKVITEYKFHQHKISSGNITDTRLLGEVFHETEEAADNHNGQFEQVDEKYKNERAKTHALEKQVRDRDDRIEQLITQLNEVRTLSRADSSKVGIFMTQEGIKIMVYKAGILRVDVDCIASASSIHLHHGKGIAKIVADAAGKSLVEECKKYICSHGTLPVGQVCSTTAGQLKYKCVIHAHGPVWHDYDKNKSTDLKKCEEHLMETVLNSLYEAERQGMKSIALPAISSATSGVPIEICVTQYVLAVQEYSSQKKGDLASALCEIHFIDANKRTIGAIQDAFIKGIQPLGFKNI